MELSPIWRRIQRSLFPRIEDCLGPLTDEHRKIVALLEIVRIEDQIQQNRCWTGRPPHDWWPIGRAFMAKAILNLSSTRALIGRLEADTTLRRILGFRAGKPLPHESAFSRVFSVLARTEIPERTHVALVDRFVKDAGIAHSALDASAIEARDKEGHQYPEASGGQNPKEAGPAEKRGNGSADREIRSGPPSAHDTGQDEKGPSPGLFVGCQDEQSGEVRGMEGLQAPCLGRGRGTSRRLSSDLGLSS